MLKHIYNCLDICSRRAALFANSRVRVRKHGITDCRITELSSQPLINDRFTALLQIRLNDLKLLCRYFIAIGKNQVVVFMDVFQLTFILKPFPRRI
jgi:hypothetical protein